MWKSPRARPARGRGRAEPGRARPSCRHSGAPRATCRGCKPPADGDGLVAARRARRANPRRGRLCGVAVVVVAADAAGEVVGGGWRWLPSLAVGSGWQRSAWLAVVGRGWQTAATAVTAADGARGHGTSTQTQTLLSARTRLIVYAPFLRSRPASPLRIQLSPSIWPCRTR